ncbi:hypothetical protein MKX01_021695 [Papaver californicum]|nr:hypothetical protein MKX01_021695 [Papaver californicum]
MMEEGKRSESDAIKRNGKAVIDVIDVSDNSEGDVDGGSESVEITYDLLFPDSEESVEITYDLLFPDSEDTGSFATDSQTGVTKEWTPEHDVALKRAKDKHKDKRNCFVAIMKDPEFKKYFDYCSNYDLGARWKLLNPKPSLTSSSGKGTSKPHSSSSKSGTYSHPGQSDGVKELRSVMRQQSNEEYSVQVTNFSKDFDANELRASFDKFGPLSSVYVVEERSGRTGLVSFMKKEDAEKAIFALDGSHIRVEWATPTCAALLVCRACGKKADHSKCPDKNLAAPLDSFSDNPDTSTSKPEMSNDAYHALCVSGLPEDISEHDVRKLIDSFDTIRSVYVNTDKRTNKKRTNKSVASAVVRFWNREDAQQAIDKLQGRKFQNKVLKVFWL